MKRIKRGKSPIYKIALLILGILLIVAVYCFFRYQYLISTPVDINSTDEISFIIKKNESITTISHNLYQKKLILDIDSFKWYTKLNNIDTKIKNGRFLLEQNMTIPEITEVITKQENSQIVLTIPEGSTVEEIDQKLTDLGLIQSDDFNKAVKAFDQYEKYTFLNKEKNKNLIYPLEGYLFPDTYFLNHSQFSSEILINLMLNNFKNRISSIGLQNSKYELSEIINVASMIEKEANQDQDRPLIADIIWKRVEQNWQLGIDATLLYLKHDRGEDRVLDYQDLQKDSSYNTRIKIGLPPGPISNPGLKSIESAAFPKSNPYFYYLTSKDGEMIYAKTLDEHNRNKAKYL